MKKYIFVFLVLISVYSCKTSKYVTPETRASKELSINLSFSDDIPNDIKNIFSDKLSLFVKYYNNEPHIFYITVKDSAYYDNRLNIFIEKTKLVTLKDNSLATAANVVGLAVSILMIYNEYPLYVTFTYFREIFRLQIWFFPKVLRAIIPKNI